MAVYYGEVTNESDEKLVYVYCNGYLGYMRKSCFAPFNLPSHPEPIFSSSSTSSSNNQTQTKTQNNKTDNLQILIVAGISVIVVSIVYLIFRPGEKRITKPDYDDE